MGTEEQRSAAIAVLLRAKATLRRPEIMTALGLLQMDTPLVHAVGTGQLHMTRYLLRCKADANEECFGDSPLQLATKQGNQAMEALLRCAGAQEGNLRLLPCT
jgi:ankyrin repeat protein